MSQNELMPGRYKGRVVSCDSGVVGDNETPLVKVFFKLEEFGKTLPWTGWFSDKVNEKTGKTYTELVVEKLLELGFTGKCVSEMSDPKADAKKLFNSEKVWELDIDYQEDKNGAKTKYFEVKWINDPDKPMTSKLDHSQAVKTFKGMGIAGEIARIRKSMPVDTKKVAEAQKKVDETKVSNTELNASDIPF